MQQLSFKRHRRQMTDGAVGSLLVVDRDPLRAGGASLVKTFELRGIKQLDTVRAVRPFEVCVLCKSTGLNERPVDAV